MHQSTHIKSAMEFELMQLKAIDLFVCWLNFVRAEVNNRHLYRSNSNRLNELQTFELIVTNQHRKCFEHLNLIHLNITAIKWGSFVMETRRWLLSAIIGTKHQPFVICGLWIDFWPVWSIHLLTVLEQHVRAHLDANWCFVLIRFEGLLLICALLFVHYLVEIVFVTCLITISLFVYFEV